MEIAPLIHSRTFYHDFNQNFAVRPNDLNVQWAMNKILPAMRDVDILNGVRRMVAFNGATGIAGVAGNFRYFVKNYLSADEQTEAEKYLTDERGRDLKIFLGYVFKGNGVPKISYSDLWQMFKNTLAPIWKNQSVDTIIAPYQNCATKNVGGKISPIENINGVEIFETNENLDAEIFEKCLADHKDFCSNVDDVRILEKGGYNVISAPQNIINRLKAEAEKKTPSMSQTSPQQSPSSQTSGQAMQARQAGTNLRPPEKKSGSISPLAICAIILIVFMAVLLFVML